MTPLKRKPFAVCHLPVKWETPYKGGRVAKTLSTQRSSPKSSASKSCERSRTSSQDSSHQFSPNMEVISDAELLQQANRLLGLAAAMDFNRYHLLTRPSWSCCPAES